MLDGALVEDVQRLIRETRTAIARTVNSGLVALYWHIGARIRRDILQEARAEYGKQVIHSLSRVLIRDFGTGFTPSNLLHMVRFAEVFPAWDILSSLSRELTWTHFRTLIYLPHPLQREFYAEMARAQHWSVRELQRQIEGMLYERVALSKRPDRVIDQAIATLRTTGEMSPDMVFLDHINLGALGLRDLCAEKDLENAMLREIEVVLRELGTDFAFIRRQYRFKVDQETYAIDLLFHNRRLPGLVAVDLKRRKLRPEDFGQMELYLRWLEKYEMRPGERRPYGLILCTEASHEQIELLQLEDRGIRVAEYWTDLPPRAELTTKLHAALERARERIAMGQAGVRGSSV